MLNVKVEIPKLRGRLKATCAKHPRYNPAEHGLGAIKGGCADCTRIYQSWNLFRELQGRMQLFIAMPDFKAYRQPGKTPKPRPEPELESEAAHADR